MLTLEIVLLKSRDPMPIEHITTVSERDGRLMNVPFQPRYHMIDCYDVFVAHLYDLSPENRALLNQLVEEKKIVSWACLDKNDSSRSIASSADYIQRYQALVALIKDFHTSLLIGEQMNDPTPEEMLDYEHGLYDLKIRAEALIPSLKEG